MLYFLLAYNCPGDVCNFQSKKLHSFTQHLQSIRTCCKCEKEFHGRQTKRAYENHLKKHVVKPKLNCDLVARVLITKARSNNILLAENVVEQILVPISWVGELESKNIKQTCT